MEVSVWIYGYYIVGIWNILNDGLTQPTIILGQQNNMSHNPIPTPNQYTPDHHTNNINNRGKSINKYIQNFRDIISIYHTPTSIFIADCTSSQKYTLLAQYNIKHIFIVSLNNDQIISEYTLI
jgi:hypothetical protein